MAEYLSPGVYVEEFQSGSKPMEGVSTSTAGFIGLAERGPVKGAPQLVTGFADFKRKYGGYLSENEFGDDRFLAYAVEQFFLNGGSRAYIARVASADAKTAAGSIPEQNPVLTIQAKNPGAWGNGITVSITPASKAKTYIKEAAGNNLYVVKNASGFAAGDYVKYESKATVLYNKVVRVQDNMIEFEKPFPETVIVSPTSVVPDGVITTQEFNLTVSYDDVTEAYENLSLNAASSYYIEKKTENSNLIAAVCEPKNISAGPMSALAGSADQDVTDADVKPAEVDELSVVLTGGNNGSKATPDVFIGQAADAGKRSGIEAFKDNDNVSIIAVPGVTDPAVQLALVAHCENLASRFAVLDMKRDLCNTDEIVSARNVVDSDYAAFYHPWLTMYDALDKKNSAFPPSGALMGIYARSDNSRGVHKAPANEVVRGCVGLDIQFGKGEQDILNPKGVNLIRSFPGQGIRVWGARTASSDPSWKYINVRRLFIYIEESIKANTSWTVFEPNDANLWASVKRTIEGFLKTMWHNGALTGGSPEEAYFVNVGSSTMTQDDIDNGRLICVIGVAPVKPAEFVIFRLTQKTSEAE